MQHILNEYCQSTYEWHVPKQGIALMIDSGTQMQPINLDRSLIEHNIILGVKHVVEVPANLCQKVCNHRAEHAGLLIHGKHGLPSMYLTNYSTYIPLIAALRLGEYHELAKTDRIDDILILAKAASYPVEIVQPTTNQ
jgi:hypothetical protein